MTKAPVGYYESLDFNSPMTNQTADHLVAQLAATPLSTIIDAGCGWAELLLRLLTACPEASGHGIDHDEVHLARAERNAAERALLPRVTFSAALGTMAPADLVLCVGAEHVFGTLDQALSELRNLVRPGGRLFLGTQIWEQAPTPALVEVIGHLPTLSELIGAAVEPGWRPLGLKVASPDDWDHFEFGFLADWEQFVMSPATPAASHAARRAADRHRDDYLRRRGVLGFAFLTLGLPG